MSEMSRIAETIEMLTADTEELAWARIALREIKLFVAERHDLNLEPIANALKTYEARVADIENAKPQTPPSRL